ncbi:MAG: PocR ligand-binding domain-containing protein, partial [Oscillospiraceae bacterium]|nr:PocR ligand-binding domain-containing protein [Oscillospiraceae bacterium]
MNNSDELYLTDLISVDILQKLQDAFSEMTGMAALTTDKYGTPVTNGSNFSEFCYKYTRKSKLGENRCMRCDKTGAELTMNSHKACSYYCHAGLIDYAAPIMANGEMIGSFIGGQVLPTPPNMDEVEKTAIELGIDPEKYKKAAAKIKVVDTDTIDKSARFLRIVAECLSHLAYQSYELHKSNVEIENASHLKSDFLANMSHEIRTPMNAVLGMVDLALREEMSDTAKEYMHQIKTSAKNLLVIINDILDFSKIESGKMDVIDVSYEPLSIVNDLAAIAKSKIGNKDIEFTMNIKPDMPQSLFGDNVRIHQILLNLITNAVKFTQQGEVHLDFDCVRESDEKAVLKVSVTDTGIGIKESDFNKLFNSFQQVDSKRNRNIEGTGLGLVICKQLLELMGGRITLKSEYGKGSTFSFEVPQKIVDKTPAIPQLDEKLTVGVMLDNIYAGKQLVRDLKWIGANPVVLNDIQNLEQIECDYIIVAKDYFTDSLRDFLTKHNDVKCIVVDEFGAANDIFFPNVKVISKPVYSLNLYNAMGISNFETRDEMNEFDCFTFISPESNVLIVDDNSVNLKVAVGLIEQIKINVDTAESA